MKVTAIYVYPIKALRPIRLDAAKLTSQGVQWDRRFMIWRVDDDDPSKMTKIQIDKQHDCGLFKQEIVGDKVEVTYLTPAKPVVPAHPQQQVILEVPLTPDISALEPVELDLHLSSVKAYKMGSHYDDWFSACFGVKAALMYIGDGRRPVLGTYAPRVDDPQEQRGWLSTFSSRVTGTLGPTKVKPWITFTDLAPFLVATEKSLANVRTRLAASDNNVEMTAFRPNIVIDGDKDFDEDFWTELSAHGTPVLRLTKMCSRCPSLNVDYNTGRLAEGERGTVLKKLMSDRRVDEGAKFQPVFGKYAFLHEQQEGIVLSVGDDIHVSQRAEKRPVFDWPLRSRGAQPQYYQP